MIEAKTDERTRTLAWALLAAFWIRFLLSLPETYVVQLNDFPAYYGAGGLVLRGELDQLYTANFKWFTNMPIVAYLFTPLSHLEYDAAWKLFWWTQVASFCATFGLLVYGIRRFFPPLSAEWTLVAGAIFLSFSPVLHRCLALGQTTPMMVLIFAGLLFAYRAGHPIVAGLLLGLVCTIKIPPMLLIPLLLMRRRFDVGLSALAVLITGALASWLILGPELFGQYADRVIWDNFGRSEAAFNNQSLEGAFMRAFTDRGLADWSTIPRPWAVSASVVTIVLCLAGLLFFRAPRFLLPRRAPDDRDSATGSLVLEVSLGIALMLLLFPVVWIHYYLFLAVPMTLLPFWWRAREIPHPGWLVALLVAGLFLASGFDSHPNEWYAARDGDRLFRLRQNLQPLGALLITIGLSFPLAVIHRRLQARDSANP